MRLGSRPLSMLPRELVPSDKDYCISLLPEPLVHNCQHMRRFDLLRPRFSSRSQAMSVETGFVKEQRSGSLIHDIGRFAAIEPLRCIRASHRRTHSHL
jgi:hypothetical protein